MPKYDKNLEYHADTQTLIGERKRELIDTQTGEVIHVDQITKRAYGAKNFWKMYLMDFLTVLGIIDNKQLDIFIYIAENTNQSNNLFIGTYKQISKDVGVSEPTIAKLMKKLQ
ncbi:replication/maintenance protein RepL, partial [Bacillus cereus]|nr:replication/maintenance protein RepL [Bacillus cereus]